MADIRFLNLRFNLDNPLHQKAWYHIHNIKKDKYKSFSEAAIISIADYFDRQAQLAYDPYFETRQKEDDFADKIIETVGEKIEKALPSFLLSCLANNAMTNNSETVEISAEDAPKNDKIDWDFLGDE